MSDAAPSGAGTASGSPGLPDGFESVFASRWVDLGELRLHAVVGGHGPPLLLVHGWPETWYAWRLVMPALARHFTVVAVDRRGSGLSDKPFDGYDSATLANDMVELMAALHHERFAVVGHDVGMWIAYALAADHPDRIECLTVVEAAVPGLTPAPEIAEVQDRSNALWHWGFNRLADLSEELVEGRERLFFGWQFAHKAATPLPSEVIEVYLAALTTGRDALHGGFAPYQEIGTTIEQNARRKQQRLSLPVLTIAGERSTGDVVAATMDPVADNVHAHVVIAGCGHFPAEEAPTEVLAALEDFLAPYRGSGVQRVTDVDDGGS
ncbi:alpha/beta fold hydrolase [Mycolicibacterium mengxianglii]|uniref:alpha/beta fold hydrolase n=1 Tax=Mycolicibacterium mengxianglii TaxID=2736649 RepID=UPI0018D18E7B|nr:alpha/beta hydrolase [Mycolicibacterium mengxianglii]